MSGGELIVALVAFGGAYALVLLYMGKSRRR
jgi:hypothetical protein